METRGLLPTRPKLYQTNIVRFYDTVLNKRGLIQRIECKLKNMLKAFDDYKNKQKKCISFLICKSMYILKVYSIHCTVK